LDELGVKPDNILFDDFVEWGTTKEPGLNLTGRGNHEKERRSEQFMAHIIKIINGLDIPIAGALEPTVEPGRAVRSVAVLGSDYLGLKPKMLVQ